MREVRARSDECGLGTVAVLGEYSFRVQGGKADAAGVAVTREEDDCRARTRGLRRWVARGGWWVKSEGTGDKAVNAVAEALPETLEYCSNGEWRMEMEEKDVCL